MEKKRERRDNSQRDNCQRERDKKRERLSEDHSGCPRWVAMKTRVIESMADCVVGDRLCVAIVAEVEV